MKAAFLSPLSGSPGTWRSLLITLFLSLGLILALGSVSGLFIGCSDDDDDDPEPTATATPTATETPIPTATPTPTPAQGWGEEEIARIDGGDWLDVTANENGELLLSYLKAEQGRVWVSFRIRDENGNWMNETEVQGSENNVLYNKAFIRGSLDNNGDAHITWTDLGRESAFYNKWNAASGTFSYTPRALDVIQGDLIIHPDIVTEKDGSRQFVTSQVEWGAGFNWNYGSGFLAEAQLPLWNPGGECKTPRLAMGTNGHVYLVIYDYFFYDSHDQIGFNEFDPSTNTWAGWQAPAPVDHSAYPGFPGVAVGPDNSVHIVWFNWHAGNEYDEMAYVMRDASGNWQASEIIYSGMIMEEYYNAFFPCIAVNEDGVVMVAWATSMSTEGKMRYMVKQPGGSWSSPALITTSEDQYYPSLTSSGKKFYAAWLDKRDNDSWNIYVNDYLP